MYFVDYRNLYVYPHSKRSKFKFSASLEECRYTFTIRQGELRTPDSNQDGYYDNDLTCEWTISAEKGKIIWLFILEFDVQTDDQCKHDNLKVHVQFTKYLSLGINPLVTNGLYRPYYFDESTFILRGFGSNVSFLFHFRSKSYKQTE